MSNKITLLVLFMVLLVGFIATSLVYADQVQNSSVNSSPRDQMRENAQERQNLKDQLKENQQERIELRKEAKNMTQLKLHNVTARTTLNITESLDENNNTLLTFESSNGQNRTVKIMPDTASTRALDRLKMKVCNETNNCTIELKEVPVGKSMKAVYALQLERHYKLLGLFKAKAQDKVQVDADTGDIISVKNPWWAFLATSSD
jgi:hypothetical protein